MHLHLLVDGRCDDGEHEAACGVEGQGGRTGGVARAAWRLGPEKGMRGDGDERERPVDKAPMLNMVW